MKTERIGNDFTKREAALVGAAANHLEESGRDFILLVNARALPNGSKMFEEWSAGDASLLTATLHFVLNKYLNDLGFEQVPFPERKKS